MNSERISPFWVNGYQPFSAATTAQWMDNGNKTQRANSVAPLLISTRQGLGKSTFCRLLLPWELQDYFTESFDLTNPSSAEKQPIKLSWRKIEWLLNISTILYTN